MIKKDIYLLQKSDDFTVGYRQEVTIDLSLTKVPVLPDTILKGKVTDCCGNPIPNATVKVFTLEYLPIEHTLTDIYGNFCFKKILPPGKYNLISTANEYEVSMPYPVKVSSSCDTTVIIKLSKSELLDSGTIYGMVQDSMGNYVSNATIIISDYENPKIIRNITYSNCDGEYIVYGLKKGQYLLNVTKKGYIFPEKMPFFIQSTEFLNLDLVLTEIIHFREGTISGQIIYRGEIVPYAVVALYLIENQKHTLIQIKESNYEGVYLFTNIIPGKYLVKSNKISFIAEINESYPPKEK